MLKYRSGPISNAILLACVLALVAGALAVLRPFLPAILWATIIVVAAATTGGIALGAGGRVSQQTPGPTATKNADRRAREDHRRHGRSRSPVAEARRRLSVTADCGIT